MLGGGVTSREFQRPGMWRASWIQCGWHYLKFPVLGTCNWGWLPPSVDGFGPNRGRESPTYLQKIWPRIVPLHRKRRDRNGAKMRKGPPHNQPNLRSIHACTPNSDSITDTILYVQMEAWHGSPLSNSTSNWLRRMLILAANYWMRSGNQSGRVRGRIERTERDWTP